MGAYCPECKTKGKVIETRKLGTDTLRTQWCSKCSKTFQTVEILLEQFQLMVTALPRSKPVSPSPSPPANHIKPPSLKYEFGSGDLEDRLDQLVAHIVDPDERDHQRVIYSSVANNTHLPAELPLHPVKSADDYRMYQAIKELMRKEKGLGPFDKISYVEAYDYWSALQKQAQKS